MTRADKIRNMTDEELVEFAFKNDIDDCLHFCKNKSDCEGDIDKNTLMQMCKQCMLEWIREDVPGNLKYEPDYQEAINYFSNKLKQGVGKNRQKFYYIAIHALMKEKQHTVLRNSTKVKFL